MPNRTILIYYAWTRPGETSAPLAVIDNRFPTLFESRRMSFPTFAEFADTSRFDQSVAGFLDHIMKQNFAAFVELVESLTGKPAIEIERIADDGTRTPLDADLLQDVDTAIVISFDSRRTIQAPDANEIAAVKAFLSAPDNLLFICPHHDIGDVSGVAPGQHLQHQLTEFLHHGDKTIPPQQQFGGFARALLAALEVPVENRFGLHPAAEADGSPAPIDADRALDRLSLLRGVHNFNLHRHLPQLERLGVAITKLDVLARQTIDPSVPPHPYLQHRADFDSLLQSRANTFTGTLLVGDATLWSSTAGGTESLRALWTNVIQRPRRT